MYSFLRKNPACLLLIRLTKEKNRKKTPVKETLLFNSTTNSIKKIPFKKKDYPPYRKFGKDLQRTKFSSITTSRFLSLVN